MADIKYSLELYSYWHCGSGLSSGADADALTVKDKDGLPFVPGKTIKGLVREAVEEIGSSDSLSFLGKEGVFQSDCFFSDATLIDKDEIIASKLQDGLFDRIASTRIDPITGTAANGSLRTIEVVIPCKLTGEILNVPIGFSSVIINALAYIKRIGLQRNRGLGRCHFIVEEEK